MNILLCLFFVLGCSRNYDSFHITNLIDRAKYRFLDKPFLGYSYARKSLVNVLCGKSYYPSVIIMGHDGMGKKALVEHVASLCVRDDLFFNNNQRYIDIKRNIIYINFSHLIDNNPYNRIPVKKFLDEFQKIYTYYNSKNVIFYIPDFDKVVSNCNKILFLKKFLIDYNVILTMNINDITYQDLLKMPAEIIALEQMSMKDFEQMFIVWKKYFSRTKLVNFNHIGVEVYDITDGSPYDIVSFLEGIIKTTSNMEYKKDNNGYMIIEPHHVKQYYDSVIYEFSYDFHMT